MFHICPRCGIGIAGPRRQVLCGPCNRKRQADSRTWAAYAAMREQEYERRADEQIRLAAEAEHQRIAAIAAEELADWLNQDVH